MSVTEANATPGRYFTGKPCRKGHRAERFAGNRECVECARLRWAVDPTKKARTKASAIRHQAKRTAQQKERYWADPEAARAYSCRRRMDHLEDALAYEARQRDKHRETINRYAAQRYITNKADIRAASAKWEKANRDKVAAKTARRRAAKLQATPPWADHSKIGSFYALARQMTLATGVLYEVDHIVPLQGKNVCGLHVETNLQVITKSENSRKRNKLLIDAALK